MRQAYIVTYDICDPARLRRIYKTMLGFGDHIQLSVFRCELGDSELIEMRAQLSEIIHHGQDQVLVISLGPVDGRAKTAIESIGKVFIDAERVAVVL